MIATARMMRVQPLDIKNGSAGLRLSRARNKIPAKARNPARNKQTMHATFLSRSPSGTTDIAESAKTATIINPHKYQIVFIIFII